MSPVERVDRPGSLVLFGFFIVLNILAAVWVVLKVLWVLIGPVLIHDSLITQLAKAGDTNMLMALLLENGLTLVAALVAMVFFVKTLKAFARHSAESPATALSTLTSLLWVVLCVGLVKVGAFSYLIGVASEGVRLTVIGNIVLPTLWYLLAFRYLKRSQALRAYYA